MSKSLFLSNNLHISPEKSTEDQPQKNNLLAAMNSSGSNIVKQTSHQKKKEQSKQNHWINKKMIVESRLKQKDSIVDKYHQSKQKDQKSQICRFYLRGLCIFKAEDCNYSHGVDDFFFKRLNLEEFEKKLIEKYENGEHLTIPQPETEEEDDDEEEKDSQSKHITRQPSLGLEYSYKVLYDYQHNLILSGELKKPYTLEELNKVRDNRRLIREVLHREVQQDFVHFLFKEYNAKYLPKDFVSAFFKTLDWQSKFKKIINSHCCYETQHPKLGPILLLLPQGEEYDEIFFKGCAELMKNHKLIENLPIRSSTIMNLYRSDLQAKDPFLPDINWYTYQKKVQLDDILQDTQANPKFIKILADELGVKEEELQQKQPFFQHERDFNVQMRDQILEEYNSKPVKEGKSTLCRFFMRGLCILKPHECKFAHGIQDLQFKKLDIDHLEQEVPKKKKDEDYKAWEKTWADVVKREQPSLSLEFTYVNLHEYQQKFYKEGKLKKMFTNQQIDDDEKYRRDTRVLMHTELTQEFVTFLFKEAYPEREYFRKTTIDKCFQSIAWMTNWHKILDGEFGYEIKQSNNDSLIKLIPSDAEFKRIIEDSIIQIIQENDLLNHLPVTPKTISKIFYKDIVPKKPHIPTLNVYQKKFGVDLDQILNDLQESKDFRQRLAIACNKPIDEFFNEVLFDSTESEMFELMKKMQKILNDLIEKSHMGFILYSRFEETVQKRCKKEIDLFNNNYQQIRRIQRAIALKSGVLVINLASELYLFSLHKFLSSNLDTLKTKYIRKLNNKCSKKPHTPSNKPQEPHAPLIDPGLSQNENDQKAQTQDQGDKKTTTKKMPEAEFTKEELEKEMDLIKIIVVDTEETIEIAYEHIIKCEDIAIDLEGNLSKEGMIELIQIGCDSKIYIFDVYKVIQTSQQLHQKMVDCIKKIMENPRICKVFHDCRKDSLALHLFANSCTLNSYDVSGAYMLVQHLRLYDTMKKKGLDLEIFDETPRKLPKIQKKPSKNEEKKGEGEEEQKINPIKPSKLSGELSEEQCIDLKGYIEDMGNLGRLLDDIKSPGLNDVLLGCGASHGANKLKNLMKKRFQEAPREYFLKRPIDLDFLVYSAKDVEDLVEVKNKLNKMLKEELEKFVGEFEFDKIILLAEKVSKTYILHGCTNC